MGVDLHVNDARTTMHFAMYTQRQKQADSRNMRKCSAMCSSAHG
jgi:hypothetical protein